MRLAETTNTMLLIPKLVFNPPNESILATDDENKVIASLTYNYELVKTAPRF